MKPEPNEDSFAVVDEASVKEEFDEPEGSENDSTDGEDSEEEVIPKPRKAKRARTSAAKPKAPRKKNVRGKQGGLEGMMKMPLEIFTEIAYHISPGDLIALIRCNKFFRNMLLRRSAILIWQRATENVPGLPPCPSEMCEPQYAALMFSKNCTLCGATATARPDPYLQVRLCSACRDTQLEAWNQDHSCDYAHLVSCSEVSKPKKIGGGRRARNSIAQYYSLLPEVQEVREKIEELEDSGDRSVYSSWARERQKIIRLRIKEANTLQGYIESTSRSHDEEMADARKQRREIIHSRIKELGWTTEDLSFYPEYAKPWNALVETSKPLTDRIWKNMLPKLITLLEDNRVQRLENERIESRIQRRKRLGHLLLKMKRTEHPFAAAHAAIKRKPRSEKPLALDSDLSGSDSDSNTDTNTKPNLNPNPSSDPDSDSDSYWGLGWNRTKRLPTLTESWGMQRQRAVVPNPFPFTGVVLEWECLKDLGETDASLERVEELFNERQEQVRQEVANWRVRFEGQLVEIYEAGAEGTALGAAVGSLESEGTKAEPVVKVKGSTDTTKDLPPNVRLLLRADTIFKKDPPDPEIRSILRPREERPPSISSLHYYPDVISHGGFFSEHTIWPNRPSRDVSLEKLRRYTEAESIVKKMLAEIQMPDASRMELDAMKARFVCGRCTDSKPRRWDELVLHYIIQRKQWEEDSTKVGLHPTRHPVVFRDVHDLEWTTNSKSLIRILTVEEVSQMNIAPVTRADPIECQLCYGTGRDYYSWSLDDMKIHLQDVHDVPDPTEGLYYRIGREMSPVSDIINDDWHNEWDAFHDAQAATIASETASSVAHD